MLFWLSFSVSLLFGFAEPVPGFLQIYFSLADLQILCKQDVKIKAEMLTALVQKVCGDIQSNTSK